ncbi:MAG: helix-turn-helix domain-containing protein [Solirubrobacteraceae bacterium]|nr:helix-turn-helix domain-containing protein [Solirubrobacteraceae bacterium]
MSPEELRTARERVSLRQTEAAKAIGVIPNTIWRWESGMTVPHRRFWQAIEAAYRLSDPQGPATRDEVHRLARRVSDLEERLDRLTGEGLKDPPDGGP